MPTINLLLENQLGSSGINVFYRKVGDSAWVNHGLITSSTTSVNIESLDENYIYEFKVQNVNGTNPYSLIMRQVKLTQPDVTFSITNTIIGVSFSGIASSISSYRVDVATAAAPGTIIATETVSSPSGAHTINFTGLIPNTTYVVTVNIIASEFLKPFTFTKTTGVIAACADPISVTVTFND